MVKATPRRTLRRSSGHTRLLGIVFALILTTTFLFAWTQNERRWTRASDETRRRTSALRRYASVVGARSRVDFRGMSETRHAVRGEMEMFARSSLRPGDVVFEVPYEDVIKDAHPTSLIRRLLGRRGTWRYSACLPWGDAKKYLRGSHLNYDVLEASRLLGDVVVDRETYHRASFLVRSRVHALGAGALLGLVPLSDMLNYSPTPNVGNCVVLESEEMDGKRRMVFRCVALRDVREGDALTTSYWRSDRSGSVEEAEVLARTWEIEG